MKKVVLTFIFVSFVYATVAEADVPPKRYTPVSRPHSAAEVARDFSIMYGALWVSFVIHQPWVLQEISFNKFEKNWTEVGATLMDPSSPFANFLGHPYAGSEFYLYFRSKGYAPKWAALNMLISSTMFESLVEAFNEPFSGIDFIITPLFGLPVGVMREREGLRLVNSDSRAKRIWGHIVYPETNLWFFERAEINPVYQPSAGFGGLFFYATF